MRSELFSRRQLAWLSEGSICDELLVLVRGISVQPTIEKNKRADIVGRVRCDLRRRGVQDGTMDRPDSQGRRPKRRRFHAPAPPAVMGGGCAAGTSAAR